MDAQLFGIVFYLAVLFLSASVHELMHGLAADKLGDPTPRLQGRLTLNPIAHFDFFGSFLLPLSMYLFSSSMFSQPLVFGYAKPVQYNPYNLRAGRFSEAIVAAAGPLSNLVIALVFGLLIRLDLFPATNDLFFIIVLTNVMLFIINMIPIPPIDGSKIIEAIMPAGLAYSYARFRTVLDMNPFLGFGVLILLIYMFSGQIGGFIVGIASTIAGI